MSEIKKRNPFDVEGDISQLTPEMITFARRKILEGKGEWVSRDGFTIFRWRD